MYKRFVVWFAVFFVTLGSAVCAFVYIKDPLHYYHKLSSKDYFGATERYQMPGLIRNLDYDTLFVGTSMGRNFVEKEADTWFHSKSFNGSLPGSTAREQNMTAKLAEQNRDVKHVIWELNYYSFTVSPDWVVQDSSPFPTYMYDENKLNDLEYLLSPYTRLMGVTNWEANIKQSPDARDPYALYKFGYGIPQYTIEAAKKSLDNTKPQAVAADETAKTMLESFDVNVLSFMKEHPNTQFTLFYAPYCITTHAWYEKLNPKYTDEHIAFKREVYKRIAGLPNVKLFDFQDEQQIVYNVANYMSDSTHYYQYVNDWMIQQMATAPAITNEQAYDERLQKFSKMVREFDISQLRSEPAKLTQ